MIVKAINQDEFRDFSFFNADWKQREYTKPIDSASTTMASSSSSTLNSTTTTNTSTSGRTTPSNVNPIDATINVNTNPSETLSLSSNILNCSDNNNNNNNNTNHNFVTISTQSALPPSPPLPPPPPPPPLHPLHALNDHHHQQNHVYRQDDSKNSISLLPLPSNSFQTQPSHLDQYVALMAYMKPLPSNNHQQHQQQQHHQQQQQQHHQHLAYSPVYPIQFNPNHALKLLMHHHQQQQQQQYPISKHYHNYQLNQSFKKSNLNYKSKFAPYVSSSVTSDTSVRIETETSGSSSSSKANALEGAKSSANASRDDSSTVSTSSSPPLSSSSLNNSYLKQYDSLNRNSHKYASDSHNNNNNYKFASGLDFNFFNKPINFMSNYRAHYANVNSSQTLCRLGVGCKFKRENKCKYFHPTTTSGASSSVNQSKKISKSIEISEYSIENDNELDVDFENVFEPDKIKGESEVVVPKTEENEESIKTEKS